MGDRISIRNLERAGQEIGKGREDASAGRRKRRKRDKEALGPDRFTHQTKEAMRAAILSWFGPLKSADGRISPKIRTRVTDRSTAT